MEMGYWFFRYYCNRVRLGVERAKILAKALKVHPGVLVFPCWELPNEVAA